MASTLEDFFFSLDTWSTFSCRHAAKIHPPHDNALDFAQKFIQYSPWYQKKESRVLAHIS